MLARLSIVHVPSVVQWFGRVELATLNSCLTPFSSVVQLLEKITAVAGPLGLVSSESQTLLAGGGRVWGIPARGV